jgi:hypothetical protein
MVPSPITVFTVGAAIDRGCWRRYSTSSRIIPGQSGDLEWPSTHSQAKPVLADLRAGWMMTRSPISACWIVAFAPTKESRPMATPGPMTAPAEIRVPRPISAPLPMTLRGGSKRDVPDSAGNDASLPGSSATATTWSRRTAEGYAWEDRGCMLDMGSAASKTATALGTRSVWRAWQTQAEAAVPPKSLRYFGLSRKLSSPEQLTRADAAPLIRASGSPRTSFAPPHAARRAATSAAGQEKAGVVHPRKTGRRSADQVLIRSGRRRRCGIPALRRTLRPTRRRPHRRGAGLAETPKYRGADRGSQGSIVGDFDPGIIVLVHVRTEQGAASAKTAPLKPSSRGTIGNGNCTSAVAPRKTFPPRASSVSRSRGPMPEDSKPRTRSPPLKNASEIRTSSPIPVMCPPCTFTKPMTSRSGRTSWK